jgi:hypothetical protein
MCGTKIVSFEILQIMQPLANEVRAGGTKLKLDNDDKDFLSIFHQLVGGVVAGDMNVVLYRIVKQQWRTGGRDPVRRGLVVTDSHVFLVDEGYVGDGSLAGGAGGGHNLGGARLRLIDSFELSLITEIRPADEDPTAITLVFKSKGLAQRPHKWRLLTRDGSTAEKCVEVIRGLK